MEINNFEISSVENIVDYFNRDENKSKKKIISIRNGAKESHLNILNGFFRENKDYRLVLSLYLSDSIPKDYIKHLEVFKYLTEVEEVVILTLGSEPLVSLDNLEHLTKLKIFHLCGYYKKTISLKPIEKIKELEELELDWGMNKAQQKIVNSLENLKKLNIRSIDLSDFNIKKDLEDLTIKYSVKEHLKIIHLFPNLTHLSLENCKEIKDFDFLDNLSKLQELSLNYMNQIVDFPKLNNQKSIRKLMLLEARNLQNIKNILIFENLEKLAITRIKKLKASDFKNFKNLKNLSTLYADFESNNKEREKFEELANNNKWKKSMLVW